eukprot:TRINITY_DN9359_c0_g1_i1.p1 TRINITY_DN9359_c0_g1~~TRINITY_DN9359_c0_g1_i1.p1  ORF type:complete len:810 (-),score=146.53 TRINITY_DN9359_c0_g1_i1:6-2435(-)
MGVVYDYAILCNLCAPGRTFSENAELLRHMLRRLKGAGLQYSVCLHESPGKIPAESKYRLLVLILPLPDTLQTAVREQRLLDWMSGVCTAQHVVEDVQISASERLRVTHHLLTSAEHANVVAGGLVESLYPIHDETFNHEWVRAWATKWLVTDGDINTIRDHFGEQVALYFLFLRFYTHALALPALLGLLVSVLVLVFGLETLSEQLFLSAPAALVVVVWAIVFLHYWKRECNRVVAGMWLIGDLSSVDEKRPEFKPSTFIKDPVTAETIPHEPEYKRWLKRCVAIPVALFVLVCLVFVFAGILSFEIYMKEHYRGPYPSLLRFLPAVVYSLSLDAINKLLTSLSVWFNEWENHETLRAYDDHLARKVFVLQYLTAFFSLFFVGFFYIPYSPMIAEYFSIQISVSGERLRKQIVFLLGIGQFVNFLKEIFVPFAVRYAKSVAESIFSRKTAPTTRPPPHVSEHAPSTSGPQPSVKFAISASDDDNDSDSELVALYRHFSGLEHRPGADVHSKVPKTQVSRIFEESRMERYTTYEDFAEMAVQFGYVVMFSCVWPLAPVAALLNNFFELRSDAVKICVNKQRPVPLRSDTIGASWEHIFDFLVWCGGLTLPALYLIYHHADEPDPIDLGEVLRVLAVEHLLFIFSYMFKSSVPTTAPEVSAKRRREEHAMRSNMLRQRLPSGVESVLAQPPPSLPATEAVRSLASASAQDSHQAPPSRRSPSQAIGTSASLPAPNVERHNSLPNYAEYLHKYRLSQAATAPAALAGLSVLHPRRARGSRESSFSRTPSQPSSAINTPRHQAHSLDPEHLH